MRVFLLCLVVLVSTQCAEKSEKHRKVRTWHGAMQGLAESMNELLPFLIQDKPFTSASQKKQYEDSVKRLSELSDKMDFSKMIYPSDDLSLAFLAEDFSNHLARLRDLSQRRSPEEMRRPVRQLARYCVACHTRVPASSTQVYRENDPLLKEFHPFERATYFTAFRYYEASLLQYEKALGDRQWRRENPRKWAEAIMNLLAISVRVKNNANLTVELISSLFDRKIIPKGLEPAARVWQRQAKLWEKEKEPSDPLSAAARLLNRGVDSERKLRHSGLLAFVRASAQLNQYLQKAERTQEEKQRFYYYSGLVAENLRRLNFSEFPRSHFQACLAVSPSGNWAQRCRSKIKGPKKS